MTAPCASCPWRRSSTPGGVDIPGFDMDKMRNLACTVGDGDGFRPIMACHGSTEGNDRPCAGYLYRHGMSNLNVRVLAMRGSIDLAVNAEDCADLDLFDTFDEMLDASETAVGL